MLEELLFPEIKETPQDILKKYPKRQNTKVVTRIAPSPTWYLHIWAIYSAFIDNIFAKKDENGVFFLRIEDTDQKREVEWAKKLFIDIFKKFSFDFKEWPIWPNYEDVWNYWPYTQSEREYIYKVFIKDLVKKWLAYPCFMSEDEINSIRSIQEASKIPTWIYWEYSKWRDASFEDVKKELESWNKFVVRFKSNWHIVNKVEVEDLIKGKVVTWDNFLDIVIMKNNWIPTYHFAHLIDDYLMWTTLVIRSDEWFASLPLHNQLFKTMWWQSPEYAHYAPLWKLDWTSKRKISKRKDPEADIEYYFREWYLVEWILDYLSNLINAWFEDWRKENLGKSLYEFDFKLSKMNSSLVLFDLAKLNSVNAWIIKNMDLETLYEKLTSYLNIYENDFYQNTFLKFPKEYNLKIIKELSTKLVKFGEYKELTTFFYNDFLVNGNITSLLVNPKMKIENIDIAKKWIQLALDILSARKDDFESVEEVKNIFVEEIVKAQMKNWQVLWPVRVALSGEEFSPWALELIFILWVKKSIERIEKLLKLI